MKLVILLLCLLTVYGGTVHKDVFQATLKTGKKSFTCSFMVRLEDMEILSATVKCPPKIKNVKFTNLKLEGNLAEYLVSFRLPKRPMKKPTPIMKISIVSPCPTGYTQVCTPGNSGCRYGMEEYCPGDGSSHDTRGHHMAEKCSCIPSTVVETAQAAGVHPLGSCHDECVCLQQVCQAVPEQHHWGYEGPTGPEYWGEQYPACNGLKQSPINIVTDGATWMEEPSPSLSFSNYEQIRLAQLGNTEEHYHSLDNTRLVSGSIKNNGHTAQLDVIETLPGDVGVLSGGPLDSHYQVLQLHFHWGADDTQGSEHTLDGQSFPMELHIVHKKVDEENFLEVEGGLAVTGFFFEIDSEDNAAIDPLVEGLEHIMNTNDNYDMAGSAFKITDLIGDSISSFSNSSTTPATTTSTGYSSYSGSLTTPGCMEIVNWINFLKPIKISSDQLAKFRMLKDAKDNDVVDNFRPPQPLNNRTVTFYNI